MTKNFWKGRRVLVTGGTGFIGFALSKKLLQSGAIVYVLSNKHPLPTHIANDALAKKILFARGSVADRRIVDKLLAEGKIQTIFHLAAEAIVGRCFEHPDIALDTNVRGTWTVLESARTSDTVPEVVVASSDKAYGSHAKLPYSENAPLQGRNPYDCSKSCADLIVQMYGKTYEIPVAVVRSANIYGPGDTNWSRLIPDAIQTHLKHKIFMIRSDGTFKRDYLFIDDVLEGYMRLAQLLRKKKLAGEAFNLGGGSGISVLRVLETLEKAVKSPIERVILGQGKHEIKKQYLDSRKARRVLGWSARTSLIEGLKKTVAWHRKYNTIVRKRAL